MKTVVITGGSEGLGFSISKKYLKEGWRVISIARHKSSIEDVISIEADLTIPNEIERVSDLIHTKYKNVDLVVINAGILLIEKLGTNSYKKSLQVLKLNLLAPLMIISSLHDLIVTNQTDIVNVCSTSAYKGRKDWAIYGMSKWGVRGLHESLKEEFHDSKVRVMLFSPPALKSKHFEKAGIHIEDDSSFVEPDDLANMLYTMVDIPKNIQVGEVIINKKPN